MIEAPNALRKGPHERVDMDTQRATSTTTTTDNTRSITHQWFLVKIVGTGYSQQLEPYLTFRVMNQEKHRIKGQDPIRTRAQRRMKKSSLRFFQQCHARRGMLRDCESSPKVMRASLIYTE